MLSCVLHAPTTSYSLRYNFCLLRNTPYDLYQFRNTSKIINLFKHLVRLVKLVFSPLQGLPTQDCRTQRDADRHLYLEWDTNTLSVGAVKYNSLDRPALWLADRPINIVHKRRKPSLKVIPQVDFIHIQGKNWNLQPGPYH